MVSSNEQRNRSYPDANENRTATATCLPHPLFSDSGALTPCGRSPTTRRKNLD